MDEEAQLRFEAELCWCIQKLESALSSGKLKEKQAQDTTKTLKVLQSSKAPLVKKRQIMSTQFGNYRSKMEEEEKKVKKATKIEFKKSAPSKKSCFVRKCAKLSSKEDAFIHEREETKNSVLGFQSSDNNFRFQFEET